MFLDLRAVLVFFYLCLSLNQEDPVSVDKEPFGTVFGISHSENALFELWASSYSPGCIGMAQPEKEN